MVDYQARTKDLISSLDNLKEELQKVNKKHNDFISRNSVEDKEADVNHALVFCKVLEGEIQAISKRSKNLIENRYLNLKKMQHLLAIINNEAHFPKFLDVFNQKIGNDFSLNAIENPDIIGTNKEALSYLFHVLCRDRVYTPINQKINSFKGQSEIYFKEDVSILDRIEPEDLVEFSFYFIFTLLYSDFNASLSGFYTKLSYTELITFNVFFNLKLQSLGVLEVKRKNEIKNFFEKKFKNLAEYNIHKKNILEEIKLNLETIQDLNSSLSEIKSLETSLIPKLQDSSVPMPKKNLLLDSLKTLEEKQELCDAEYQEISKHKFINKSKSVSEKSKIKKAELKEKQELENNKSIEALTETLSRLAENLSESLSHIKGIAQEDINRSRQKVSSALVKLSASMQRFLSDLSICQHTKKTQDLEKLSLPKLLEIAEKLVNTNCLLEKENFKKKLIELQELHNNSTFSVSFLINLIINKYLKFNNEVKNILNRLSNSFMNDINPHFFPKKFKNKKESQTYEKLKDEYFILKEQSSWFEKLLSLIKCEADDRMFKLYATISVEAEDYQKSYKILNEKIKSFKRNSYKKSNLSKKTFSTNKERLSYPLESINEIKTGSARDSSNDKMEVIPFNTKINNELQTFNEDVINQSRLDAEEKFTEKSKVFEASQEISLGNNDVSDVIKLQVYEAWDVEFEKWKNVQNPKLYELFHVIESCSKSVLNGSNKAFLKCLSLYQKECADKNDELKEKKNQIDLYLKNSKEGEIVITYLAQHQKWFDEIFQRIALCRTLILQNEEGLVIQESPRLPSALADNRAEFNNLLTFYLGATDKYNKFRDDLISEENKLNNLNRNFIKLMLGSLNQITNEANVLSDFSKQLDRVNQLKLVIEQEYETKQKIKEKLTLLTSPEIVKFYISRIDPCDADYFKNEDTYLQAVEVPTTAAANYFIPATPQSNICTLPAAFYYTPSMPVCYSAEVVPSNNQLFYSM